VPRKGRGSKRPPTQSGAPAQTPRTPVDAPYGEGERAIESQRRTPLPNYSAEPTNPGPAGASGPPPMAPADRLQAALMAAKGMAPPTNLLTEPTQRPQEPITSGLNIGPGPGTEVLASGDRAVRTLRMLAEVTADAGFANLAELAAQRNR
jgi:hypothetical protein